MKLYIVIEERSKHGSLIHGVFESLEKAEEFAKEESKHSFFDFFVKMVFLNNEA